MTERRLASLEPYKDEVGNEVVYDGQPTQGKIDIRIKGGGNRLVVAPTARIVHLSVFFTGDNGLIQIGPTSKPRAGLRLELRVGHDSYVEIGENVGSSGLVFISAVEGAEVIVGCDVMFAGGIELRTDDTHPIYDVRSGKRLNMSRSIHIGKHVWIAKHATVMGGGAVGDGSVLGMRSILTTSIPNNCVAVGAPARVVRRDVAWERTEVPYRRPERYPRPTELSIEYWNLTSDDGRPKAGPRGAPRRMRAVAAARRAARKLPRPVRVVLVRLRASLNSRPRRATSASMR